MNMKRIALLVVAALRWIRFRSERTARNLLLALSATIAFVAECV